MASRAGRPRRAAGSGAATPPRRHSAPTRPRALLLDFGGTLDADGVPWCTSFYRAYRASGGTVSRRAFATHFARTDERLLADTAVRRLGYRALVRRQAELLVALLPDRVPSEDLATGVHERALRTVQRNRPVLERLAARLRLAVVSNFCGNLRPCLDELGLLPFVTVALDSAELGVRKPDPRIFQAALHELRVQAARAWFVGDNPYADVAPALALGMHACWVAPARRRRPAGIEPSARIARFADIEGVLP